MSQQQARKDITGKLPWNYLIDEFLEEMIRVRVFGATKYATRDGDGNVVELSPWDWMHGRDWTDYTDAIKRHIKDFHSGNREDEESGLHPMAHLAVDAMFLYFFDCHGIGDDNRPGVMAERILERIRAGGATEEEMAQEAVVIPMPKPVEVVNDANHFPPAFKDLPRPEDSADEICDEDIFIPGYPAKVDVKA